MIRRTAGRRSATRLGRTAAALALVGALAGGLAACSTPGGAPGAADTADASGATDAANAFDESAACAGRASVDLMALPRVTDPRAITGPSTACLADDAVPVLAADPSPVLPATVTDNQGTNVTVTDASRILALDMSGTLAATVFSLGLGDHVVGRDTSTGFTQAAGLPEVTRGGHQLSAEAILALAPTVIITDSSIGPWDVVLQMRQAGIPVVVVTPDRSLDTVGTLVQTVADALGVHAEGASVAAQLGAQIAKTVARIAAVAPADEADRLRILFLYVRGNAGVYYVFGGESGADALITSLGAVDVASSVGITGMRPISAEALVSAAPDVILVMTKGLESTGGIDGLLERVPAIASTPAGENRRIVDMSDYQILSFGPRTPAVLAALAGALYAPVTLSPSATPAPAPTPAAAR